MTNKHGDCYSNRGTGLDRLHFKPEGMDFVVRALLPGRLLRPSRIRPSARNDGPSVDVWALCAFQAELFLLLPQKIIFTLDCSGFIHQNTNTIP